MATVGPSKSGVAMRAIGHALILCLHTAAAIPADAAVLTFDDVVTLPVRFGGTHPIIIREAPVPAGYGEFTWLNLSILNATAEPIPSGYANGAVSGDYIAANASFGAPAAVVGDLFNFHSAYFTAAWRNDLKIDVAGFLGETPLYTQSFFADTTGPILIEFDFLGIDSLVFAASGGVDADFGGTGTHFAIDNFAFSRSTPVPEVSSIVLVASGMALLVLRRRAGMRFTAAQSPRRHSSDHNFGQGGQALNRQNEGEKQMAISVRCVRD